MAFIRHRRLSRATEPHFAWMTGVCEVWLRPSHLHCPSFCLQNPLLECDAHGWRWRPHYADRGTATYTRRWRLPGTQRLTRWAQRCFEGG